MPLSITSEVGRLRRVIVHEPGPEVAAVTPLNRQQFLYDDIISRDGAAEEHRRFASILKRFATVYELRTLLEETLQSDEARSFLLERSEEMTSDRRLSQGLADSSADQLAQRFIEGWLGQPGPFSRALEYRGFLLPPLPNLFFTRDAAMVIGDRPVISHMRFASRWTEALLMRTIFGFHPEIGGTEPLYDGSAERRHDYPLEGGDIHPIRPDLVVMGISERTSVAAADAIAELLFEQTEVTDVISVVLPERSTAIHLDMVWTQLDTELAAVYPPLFRGPFRAPVLHRSKGKDQVREPDGLFEALADVGYRMAPIFTGGPDRSMQEREQWGSGCNFFAVAPGQVLCYSRNDVTVADLERAGFRAVDSVPLLLGDDEVKPGERCVITFAGSELVRGGGGPHCMTCPLERDPL